ncbi:hypothetical protein DFH27DRAFT_584893 [Peziza echinospora]|nr:hypothetical protein DFH27DRAFT_584893 [Peziza echinospora]
MSATIDYEAKAIVAKDAFQGAVEGEFNLLVEEEAGELLEQRHTGTGVDVVTITEGLKANAPAAYLRGPSKRYVFTVGGDGTIKSFAIDNEEYEYDEEPGPISNLSLKVHPQSQLAAAFSPEGPIVAYQDESGQINAVLASDPTSWSHLGPLSKASKPVIGTPLSFIAAAEGLKLYYLSSDGHAHYLTDPQSSGASKDHQVDWANLGSGKVKRFVTRQGGEGSVFLHVLGSDNSFSINTPEKAEVLGKVNKDGTLDLANKEECGRVWGGYYGGGWGGVHQGGYGNVNVNIYGNGNYVNVGRW